MSTSGLAFCSRVEHGSESPHEDKTTWCSANDERKICSRARSSMGFITSVCVHCTIARGAVADGNVCSMLHHALCLSAARNFDEVQSRYVSESSLMFLFSSLAEPQVQVQVQRNLASNLQTPRFCLQNFRETTTRRVGRGRAQDHSDSGSGAWGSGAFARCVEQQQRATTTTAGSTTTTDASATATTAARKARGRGSGTLAAAGGCTRGV